jgi:hypothetical protein
MGMRVPKIGKYKGAKDKFFGVGTEGGGTIEWQPGDGRRWMLFARPLLKPEADIIGSSEGDLMVSVFALGCWCTLPLSPGAFHEEHYVAEKLPPHVAKDRKTLLMVVAFLNAVLGDEGYAAEVFDRAMGNPRR